MATIITLHVMKVICCYCGKDLGGRRCTPEMSGSVSHGICRKCDKELRHRLGLPLESDTTLLEELNA